jgi:hypothetical protein
MQETILNPTGLIFEPTRPWRSLANTARNGHHLHMPLTCNIDACGKRARLINGLVLLAIGLALMVFLAWPSGTPWLWIVSGVCVLLGAFCIFEARAGWCALRAMKIKTPL